MSEGHFDRKQIIINSQFRDAGSPSTTDFTWRFEERIEGVRHAELRYFVFENGAYNITSSNNQFELYEYSDTAGTSLVGSNVVTIPVGAYDDTSLVQAIGLAMTLTSIANGANNLYFVTFDGQGKLSMTCPVGKSFQAWFDNSDPAQAGCATVLGFTATASVGANTSNQQSWASGLAYTIFGTNPQQLTNYDYLLIKSQKLGNDISFFSATGVTDQSAVIPTAPRVVPPNAPPYPPPYKSSAGCFAVVPNTVANSGNTYSIIYELQRPPQITSLKRPYSLDYVDIQVCDKYGQVIDGYTNNITIGIELFLDKKSEPRNTAERVGGSGDCGCRGCSGC
jgi:hypothetical protein